jgi:CO dehydrogenase maturation factor
MRVVLLGKGGSGKSTLSGLLSAELSHRGRRVVAMDADSVPGLAQVLGVPPTDDWFLANTAVRENGGWRLEGTPAEIVERCSVEGPGGVRFLQIGNADATFKDYEFRRESYLDRWSGTVAFNTVSRSFDDEDGWVIVDLQGGTFQVANGMAGTSGIAVVVVEPFAKSVLTARRFVEMGQWPPGMRLVGVANKVASADDEAYVEAELTRLGVPLWATVPLDPAVRRAERDGRPLVDLDSAAPARQAVARLADRLQASNTVEPIPARR